MASVFASLDFKVLTARKCRRVPMIAVDMVFVVMVSVSVTQDTMEKIATTPKLAPTDVRVMEFATTVNACVCRDLEATIALKLFRLFLVPLIAAETANVGLDDAAAFLDSQASIVLNNLRAPMTALSTVFVLLVDVIARPAMEASIAQSISLVPTIVLTWVIASVVVASAAPDSLVQIVPSPKTVRTCAVELVSAGTAIVLATLALLARIAP
jgi:hypothetical protein